MMEYLNKNKLIPSILYTDLININPDIDKVENCKAMLKNNPDMRCSRKIKKKGEEFCFYHIKMAKDGKKVRTIDEYKKTKSKKIKGKIIKNSVLVYDSDE